VLSECARAATAEEARFRVDYPNSAPRRIKIIALDRPAEGVVRRLAQKKWNCATFMTTTSEETSRSVRDWLSTLAGEAVNLLEQISAADLVVTVSTAGESADDAAVIARLVEKGFDVHRSTGAERTVLVTFNRPLFKAQYKTLRREVAKRRRKLHTLQHALERHVGKPLGGRRPTLAGTRNRVRAILTGRHMKDLFTATVEPGAAQLLTLHWSFQQDAWDRLERTLLGKTVLFTDREEWTDEQIVRAYRSQSHVEATFRQMKDPHVLTFRPIHHWTDQKLRVHALYCVLALMVLNLLRRKLAQVGITISTARMIERLAEIREVAVLFPSGSDAKPHARTVLSDLGAEQLALVEALDLARFRTP